MADEEVTVWLNVHRMEALEEQVKLRGVSLKALLHDYLTNLYVQLVPTEEQQRIEDTIVAEQKADAEEAEANRRFSVFRVTEHGKESLFLVDGEMDMLRTANTLRDYTKILEALSGYSKDMKMGNRFSDMFPKREPILEQRFQAAVEERLDNTGRVVGAYEIDLDKGEFSALNIMDGWKSFGVKDICSAAYRAMRKEYASWDSRWERFLSSLDGKELTGAPMALEVKGTRRLRPEEMRFEDEIFEGESKLNFYIPTDFNTRAVFGHHMDDLESINVYANYDIYRQRVEAALEIVGFSVDSEDVRYSYPLTSDEHKMLTEKMEAYCQQQYGQSLEEFSLEMLEEMSDPQLGSM